MKEPVDPNAIFASPASVRLRLAALGRVFAYLALALAGALVATVIAKAVFGGTLLDLARATVATGLARAVLLLLGLVIVPTAVMLRLFKENFAVSGWSPAGAPRLAGWGLVAGLGCQLVIAIILWSSGLIRFAVSQASGFGMIGGLSLSLLLWIAQAAGEEGLNRGYAFLQACRALRFWPAAILSSLVFLFGHSGNTGETMIGIGVAGLFGLALCYSVVRSGSLWFALGFHAAWNFAQSYIFGFRNSGGTPPLSLLTAHDNGPALLTGGAAGPEGSLLSLIALIALFGIIHLTCRDTAAGREA